MDEKNLDSEYYKTWEDYLAAHPDLDADKAMVMESKMQDYEEKMYSFVMFLLF